MDDEMATLRAAVHAARALDGDAKALQQQIQRLKADLLAERDRSHAAGAELARLRDELAASERALAGERAASARGRDRLATDGQAASAAAQAAYERQLRALESQLRAAEGQRDALLQENAALHRRAQEAWSAVSAQASSAGLSNGPKQGLSFRILCGVPGLHAPACRKLQRKTISHASVSGWPLQRPRSPRRVSSRPAPGKRDSRVLLTATMRPSPI
eukprot:m.157100 g.157100  ORF g.157100 m.157100 type:complete len:217 (+) comp9806_c0_seq4:117-767(+)